MIHDAIKWVTKIGSQDIVISSGRFAEQADACVVVTAGETMVMATAVVAKEPREGIDYLPLLIDYEEKLYAAGKISGSRFIKREGRPSENAILTARLIDRPLRPLFPKSFRRDIQVIVTVLSLDEKNDPDTLSILAASAALCRADNAPFKEPVGAIRIGRIDGQFIVNPNREEMEKSDLDLVVASTKERVIMIEAGAQELPDTEMLAAIKLAHESIQPQIITQEQILAARETVVKVEEGDPLQGVYDQVKAQYGQQIVELAELFDRGDRHDQYDQLIRTAKETLEGQFKQQDIVAAIEKIFHKAVRDNILTKEQRPDGRGVNDIRPIWGEVGMLPRPHGSALFTRGQSQALSVVTLGGPGDQQMIDTMEEETTKRYLHHYNFPPYSTGEVSPLRGPGRREIGHGALAERALLPVIPAEEEFPYTIRVVSEILSSNGSTSMAATCGSTLSLMDAGVPLKKPVSGIAMGLVTNEDASEFKVLTDLQGLEDFTGDMDFKIAGTADGITAVQMDTKIAGLTMPIIEQTIPQAREARLSILQKMLEVLPQPRSHLSDHAPRITTVHIDPAKIGELIGPGGKVINRIIEHSGGKEVTSIDIDDSGIVTITSTNAEMGAKALAQVESITKEIQVGEVYEGEVVNFVSQRETGKEIGALVQLAPNKTGMVHISEIASHRVEKLANELAIGQMVKVKVLDIDSARGRIALSIKALQERPAQTE